MGKAKKKGFWDRFDDLMDSLPEHIENTIDKAMEGIDYSTSSVSMNGTKIVTTTKNGKSVTTVNGKEVVPKDLADELYNTLESVIEKLEVNTLSKETSKRVSKAMRAYNKYKSKG